MPICLTRNATIQCGHGGSFNIPPGQGKMTVDGNEVVNESMLMSAVITGCTKTNTTNGEVPCTGVSSIVSGKAQKLKKENSQVILNNMVITTNGSHPSETTVILPGNEKLIAV